MKETAAFKYQFSRKGILHAFRAFFDISFLVVFTLFCLLFLLPFIFLRFRFVVQSMAKFWAATLVYVLGLRIVVENGPHLIQEGPLILLANHQSYFDILALLVAIDRDIAFMAKASLFRIPLFGWAMKASGAIPVERGHAKKARASLYKAAEQIRQGSPVLIFPEGTRGRPDGSLIPFKTGGFVLAKLAKVPLQPLSLYGPNEVLPIKQPYLIPRVFRERSIRLCIHRPIFPKEYEGLSASELSKRVAKIIERPLDRYRAFNEILDTV